MKCNQTPELVLFCDTQIPNLPNEVWNIYGVDNLPNDWTPCLRQLLSTITTVHLQLCQFPILSAVKPFFALFRYGYSKLIAEISFSCVFPTPTMQGVPIFRNRNREKNAWEQPQEITQILPCKFTNIKTLLPALWLSCKKHIQKLFHNIPTVR